jgi:hypothetical protein
MLSSFVVLLAINATMAPAGASGATLTSPAGTAYTGTVKFENIAPHAVIDTQGALPLTCATTAMEWKVESHGALVPAKGPLTGLSFGSCGTTVVTVLKAGTMEVHSGNTGEYDEVTWRGFEITVKALGKPDCIYSWGEPVFMGGLTASPLFGGKTAVFDVSTTLPVSNNPLCPHSIEITAQYQVTTPDYLDAD